MVTGCWLLAPSTSEWPLFLISGLCPTQPSQLTTIYPPTPIFISPQFSMSVGECVSPGCFNSLFHTFFCSLPFPLWDPPPHPYSFISYSYPRRGVHMSHPHFGQTLHRPPATYIEVVSGPPSGEASHPRSDSVTYVSADSWFPRELSLHSARGCAMWITRQ